MEYRTQEVKAGIVVLIALILFFGFLFAITKAGFEKKAKYYTARFGYTNGIQKGSQVRLGGVLIGEVENVYFPADDNTRVEVLLKVREDAPIRTDATAYITSIGLMGEYYVEITPGTPESPLLPSGARIMSKDIPTLSQMGEPFQKVSEQLEEFLIRLNELINEKNREHFSNIIASVDTILQESQGKAGELLVRFSELTRELKEMSEQLDELMEQNASTLNAALTQFNSSMARAESLMVKLSMATTHINNIVATNEVNLHEAIRNFQDATRHLEEFSRHLKYRPWSLVRKSTVPERKIQQE